MNKEFNILVIGGGAIGKLITTLINNISSIDNKKINLFLKAGSNYQSVKSQGIILEIQDQGILKTNSNLKIISDLTELPNNNSYLVFIATKAYSLKQVLNELKKSEINIQTIITPINGLGIEEIVLKYFPNIEIIASAITLPVEVNNIDINHAKVTNNKGGFTFARYSPCSKMSKNINFNTVKKIFELSPFETIECKYRQNMRWSKLILNIIANASAAILDMSADEIFSSEQASQIEFYMLREAFKVMDKSRSNLIDLPGYPAKKLKMLKRLVTSVIPILPFILFKKMLKKSVSKARGDKLPSFHNDIINLGRTKTEVEYYNGAIVEFGKKYSVSTPYNRALSNILQSCTTKFVKNPKRLLKTILK